MSTNDPQRPRSTPIPGDGDIFSAPPPTSGEFLGSPSPLPPGHHSPFGHGGQMPGQQPGQQPGQMPGQFAGYQPPPGGAMFGVGGPGAPLPSQAVFARQKRSGCGTFLWLFIVLTTLGGLGAGAWAVWSGLEAVRQADDVSNPELSDDDREALGLPDDVETLFEPGAAAAVVQAYEDAIGADPLRVVEVLLYTDYSFAEVQDPNVPTNTDRYGWRSGEVGDPDPQRNRDELDAALFSTDEVKWDEIPNLVAGSPNALGIPDGEVSHVIVTRGSFGVGEVVIRVYVTSPRDSGYLEARASTGEPLAGY